MTFPPDTHMHTPLCKHAVGEPSAYARRAQRKGLTEICFTDHVPAPDGYDAENRMLPDQFPEYRAMVEAAARESAVVTGFGIEADYYPGCQSFLDPWLAQQGFDIVLGSVHVLGDWGFDNPKTIERWRQSDLRAVWTEYFRLLADLADTRLFDVVGHLDLPKKFGYRLPEAVIKPLAEPALDRIAEAGMAIELNTAGLRKPAGEIYPSPFLLNLAYARDIPITFGSDAHTPDDVGADFDQAIALARAVGYTHCLRFRQRQRTLIPI